MITSMPSGGGGVRLDVPLVGDDDAGCERQDVVAVVPLLALGLVAVAAGLDEPDDGRSSAGDLDEEILSPLVSAPSGRGEDEGDERVAQIRIDGEGVAVDHRQDGIEVHRRAPGREEHRDHLARRAGGEEALGEQLDRDGRRALAHADEDAAVADHEDVAALEMRRKGRGSLQSSKSRPAKSG